MGTSESGGGETSVEERVTGQNAAPGGEEGPVSRRTFLRGGAALAALGGATGAASAQEGGTTQGGDGGGGASNEQRQVEMNDQLQFVPQDVTIRPGDTVVWVNVGNQPHSVTAYGDQIPEGASYFASGGAGSEEQARNTYPEQGQLGADDRFRHTFQTEGTYEYFCIPHEQVGMVGTVEVTTQPSGGTGGDAGPVVSDNVKTLGVVLTMAMTSVLGLAYFFLKFGGDYEEVE